MPQRKKSKKTQSVQDKSGKSFVRSSAISALFSLAVFFLIIFVFSAIMSKKETSSSVINVLPFFACAASGLVGGRSLPKGEGKRMILQSLVSSVFATLVVCAVLLLSVGNIGLRTLIAFAVTFAFYIVGALFKVNRKPKRKI